MPQFEITSPDGTKYRVNAPDGASEQDAIAYVQKNMVSAQVSQEKQAAPGISLSDKFLHGLADPINGGAQLLTKILPSGVVNAGNSLNNWLADKTGLVARLPEGGVDQQVREGEKKYQDARNAAGDTGFDWARLAGNVISPANIAIASKLPAAATMLGRVSVGAGGGMATSALSPVAQGDYATEKAKQLIIGAAAGGVVPVVTGAASRVISPNASKNANVSLLKEEGVTPTIGQTLGGRWNALEEKAQSLPIIGDMISNARRSANSQFESAAYNRALKPIGQELPKGLSGRDALIYTESALKNNYDDVLTRIGAIKPDAAFNNKVSNLQDMVNKMVMPKAEKAKFTAAINDVQQSIDNNGVITSDAFKALESSLGFDAKKLASSTNIYEGKLSPAVKQLQEELRNMLKRQAGSNADDLQSANSGWANFKRVQNAAAKIGAEDGSFTPSQFQNAVRALDKSKDKGAFARGNALGQDLGDAGKFVLGNKVPNSGTAERLLYGGGALGSYLINPAIPLGLVGGAALYTQPSQKMLNALLSSRPQSAQGIAEALGNASPMFAPLGGQIGLGLLNQ